MSSTNNQNRSSSPRVSSARHRRTVRYFIINNSYIRAPDPDRRAASPEKYKKGYELRIVVQNTAEIEKVSIALASMGFRPGAPFQKARQFVVPVYGKRAVELWNRIITEHHTA